MKWVEFIRRKELYNQVWQKMKSDYRGDMRQFLDRSYIVISYKTGQIAIEADVFSIARECPEFFAEDRYSSAYMKLVEEMGRVERLLDPEKKTIVDNKLHSFDINKLSVRENWAEVRFCTVDMLKIQLLKQSKYCDQLLTSMSWASIRVVLRVL